MGITFQGHTPNFNIWVFNIDGKRFVARNFSTPEPLNIKFFGAFDDSPLGAGLVKTSGFDITESSPRTVIWTWGGKLYTSSWDIDDTDEENISLYFSTPIPYAGPPVAPVGTGVTNTQSPPPPAVQTPVPSLPIDQNQNIMGGGQNQVRIPSPVIPNVATMPDASALVSKPSGTDWVKLGLQLGAAYLLLS